MQNLFFEIHGVFNAHNYKYENGKSAFKLNIFIVKCNNITDIELPDFIYVTYKDHKLENRILQLECYINPNIVEGQYLNVYSIGNHKESNSNRTALVQREGKIKIKNKDIIRDDYIGANIVSGDSELKNTIKIPLNSKDFFKLCQTHRELYGNSFTLTVF
jgi:hypothetical protein